MSGQKTPEIVIVAAPDPRTPPREIRTAQTKSILKARHRGKVSLRSLHSTPGKQVWREPPLAICLHKCSELRTLKTRRIPGKMKVFRFAEIFTG
jgi:hypothetical protein